MMFVMRRLLAAIPVLWAVATLTFFMMKITPGGPFDSDKRIPAEILKNIEAKYHLNEPLWQQYIRYMADLMHGDLGYSFRYADKTVIDIITSTFPVSAKLGLLGLMFAAVIGVTSGMLAASKPHSIRDYIPTGLSMIGICLPSFVMGPILVYIFAQRLQLFDVSGFDDAKDVVLPSMTLGAMYAGYFSRLSRSGILEVMRQDFIRTALSKGLPEWLVLTKHALRGGLQSSVSFFGPAATAMLTGSLVVETIFDIPGLGRFFVQSALNRDYTLVMGTVLFLAFLVILMNLLVDIAYGFLDPRVSHDS